LYIGHKAETTQRVHAPGRSCSYMDLLPRLRT
jgi:hypothetical protein